MTIFELACWGVAAIGVVVLGCFCVGNRSAEYFSKKYPLKQVEPPPSPFKKEVLRENYQYRHPINYPGDYTMASSVSCGYQSPQYCVAAPQYGGRPR